MSTLTRTDFANALRCAIPPDDEVVVLYTGIWAFAQKFDTPLRDLPALLLDTILDTIGPNRTLLMPTFSNDFVRTRRFDLKLSRVDNGVLSQLFLKTSGAQRSRQPLHSYAVLGPRAGEVLALPCTTAWGPDSIIGWMERVNARICPLGLPWHQGCSFFHWVEEHLQVPYRYFKRFAGTLLENDREIGSCAEVKYSWSLRVPAQFDHSVVRPHLGSSGVIRSGENPLIPLESARAKDIAGVTIALLERNPYAYVSNVRDVQDWVRHGKAEEIASLKPDEAWPLQISPY